MKEESMTDALLREYLLNKVDDAERARIENLFLTDAQAKERLLGAEQDLIEDYLEDSLTSEDKQLFLSIFAQTDEQRRKLRITKSIKDWALAEASVPQVVEVKESGWSRFISYLRPQPAFAVAIALVFVLGVVLFFVWSNRGVEQQTRLAIEQELAAYNSPERLREAPPNMIVRDLRPGTLRTVEREVEVSLAGSSLVELRLPWIQKERYATYQAEVLHEGGESFTIPNIQADESGAVRIRILTQFLSVGRYQINLSGITPDGRRGPSEQYNFRVVK